MNTLRLSWSGCYQRFVFSIFMWMIILSATVIAGEWGDFSGRFTVSGDLPEGPEIVASQEIAQCGVNILDESLLIDKETRGLANVFVYLKEAPDRVHPEFQVVTGPLKIVSNGCRFLPHTAIARTGQPIVFKASDSFMHHIRAVSFTNPALSKTVVDQSEATFQFEQATRFPMRARCDFHSWMEGLWLVLDHPYAAITDSRGRFEIPQIPDGEYTFIAWHERCGYIKKEWQITIEANRLTEAPTVTTPIEKLLDE